MKSTYLLITWQDIPVQNCLGLGCLKTKLSFEMDGKDNMHKDEVWKQKKKTKQKTEKDRILSREAPEQF